MRKPRHAKQNVLVRFSSGRTRVMTREHYTDMCNYNISWGKHIKIVCIIPYPSPELFAHESSS